MNHLDKIAVLIPCYNESRTIEKVVTDFKRALPDGIGVCLRQQFHGQHRRFSGKAGAIVRTEPLQGKGNVVRRMFREIDALCYIMIDGDDTYPAERQGLGG